MSCFLVVSEHNGVGYDSGHGFEQCDFTGSPMSEYGLMGTNQRLSDIYIVWQYIYIYS